MVGVVSVTFPEDHRLERVKRFAPMIKTAEEVKLATKGFVKVKFASSNRIVVLMKLVRTER